MWQSLERHWCLLTQQELFYYNHSFVMIVRTDYIYSTNWQDSILEWILFQLFKVLSTAESPFSNNDISSFRSSFNKIRTPLYFYYHKECWICTTQSYCSVPSCYSQKITQKVHLQLPCTLSFLFLKSLKMVL